MKVRYVGEDVTAKYICGSWYGGLVKGRVYNATAWLDLDNTWKYFLTDLNIWVDKSQCVEVSIKREENTMKENKIDIIGEIVSLIEQRKQKECVVEEDESVPEWMEGFEDLVYSGYELSHGDYLVVSKLSESQKIFLSHAIATHSNVTFSHRAHTCIFWHTSYHEFIGASLLMRTMTNSKEITFNDLFVPKQ